MTTITDECFDKLMETIARKDKLIDDQAKEISKLKAMLEQALDDSRQLIEQINKRGEK